MADCTFNKKRQKGLLGQRRERDGEGERKDRERENREREGEKDRERGLRWLDVLQISSSCVPCSLFELHLHWE